MRLHTLKLSLVALITALPALVFAHAGHEHTSSFMTGFLHPMGGFDHLLAMFAVGLWAASLGGRAVLAVPMAFVATMLLGGGLAVAGMAVPFIEQGILLSVIVMGALLVGAARFPAIICAAIAGVFALFHGAAHGLEMPLNANGMEYAAGFALATIALHLVGLGFGQVFARLQTPMVSRLVGSIIAIAGVVMSIA